MFADERERQAQNQFAREQFTPRTKPSTAPRQLRGHDTVLRAIQGAGTTIHVEKCDGTIKSGTLVAFDPYTLTVRGADGIRRVIYKHDISEFFTRDDEKAN